jgi:electron transport complex protein RnfE
VFGEAAKAWVITVVPNYHGFLLAILPPGAFITLGMLIAGKNWLNLRAEQKMKSSSATIMPVDSGCAPAAH